MKVTLPDLTTIECTVDEYEELIVRGLVGKKLDDLKVELEGQDGEKIVIPSTPKKSYNWPDVVPLYGCEISRSDLTDPFNTAIDCIQKIDGTVLIKEKKEET